MIRHAPYGIDDPYKRLPIERFPRDPVAGDDVQVCFTCPESTEAAWAVLRSGSEGESEVRATRLDGTTWTVWFPALASGAYEYDLYARQGAGTLRGGSFDLRVARWRAADTVLDTRVHARGATVHLESAAEAGLRARQLVCELRVPHPGVLTLEAGFDEARPVTDSLECRTTEDGGVLRVEAPGVDARVDLASRVVEVRRPGEPAVVLALPLAPTWLEAPGGAVRRLASVWEPGRDSALHGLGERFTGPDLRGGVWDTRVYEEYKEQGRRTYLPVPLLVARDGWGLFVDAAGPATFDLTRPPYATTLEAEHTEARLIQHVFVAEEPYGVTSSYTRLTGAIALPPSWAYGPWMSANTWNTQAQAEAALQRTLQEDVPATVLVLEAWSDESTFYIFNDAEYEARAGGDAPRLSDFRFGGRWPDPKGLIDACHEQDVRVLLWQIPVQKQLDAPHAQHDADEEHMLERGFAIRESDGQPYKNRGWWFTDALVLDVTDPDACAWWFGKRRYLFDELGIDGMKTDGGEHLWGRGLVAADGSRGTELVNTFAQRYVDAYHGFVRDATGGDGLTFSRAGYVGAQRSPAHWAGDENSTWNGYRASILAGLSAGLAAVSIWGFDIGGFSGDVPTVELYLRSTQVACFCPIMQFHSELHQATENRDRTPWNIAERHGDRRALDVYRLYAKLRMRLVPYIAQEAEALAAAGLPLMRMPALVFPDAYERLARDPYAYLFGRDLLVCPVVEKGGTARVVELPEGDWVDLWSGATLAGGKSVLVPAPLETIPVFARADSPRLAALLAAASEAEG